MEAVAAQLRQWLVSCPEPARDEAKPQCNRDGSMLCTVYEELVQLLQQYPGGLTEAVMLTQLQSNINRKVHAQPQETSAMSAAPLASCLGSKYRPAEEIIIHGTVCDIHIAAGKCGIQTLQLIDSSTSSPVGMFVHSQQKPLLEGLKPLLTVGRRVRAVTTLVKQLGVTTMPPLMPTVFCAVCVPATEWQQYLDSPEQLAGSFSQVYPLRDVLAGGLAALGQQELCTLNGWLTAAVVRVGSVEAGYQASNGASSRLWNTGSITLCDTADAANNGNSGGHTVQWLLLDEAVKYSQLLQAGEHILMYCPTVRRHLQHPQTEPELVLESSSSLLLLAREDGGSQLGSSSSSHNNKDTCNNTDAQESGLAGSYAAAGSASQAAAAVDNCMLGAPGEQFTVIRGVVSNLMMPNNTSSSGDSLHPLRDGSTRMTCCVSDTAADMLAGRSRALELRFEADSRNKQKVLKGLRNGHTLLLTRVTCSQQNVHSQQKQHGSPPRHLVWQESAGGVIQNLSRLPAMLTTPALHHQISLEQLQQAESCLHQSGLLLVSAAVQVADLKSCRLHRICSQPVHQGSQSHMDCDRDDDEIADDGAAAAVITQDASHCLWSCAFCGVECNGRETEPGFIGHVMLTGVSNSGEDAVKVDVDSCAWQMLQSAVTPAMEAMLSQGMADSSRLLQLAVTGQPVKAVVYARTPFGWGISAWQASDK